jgi:hypothetical protein
MKSKKRIGSIVLVIFAVAIMSITNFTKALIGNDSVTNNIPYISSELVIDAMLAGSYGENSGTYGLLTINRYNGSSTGMLNNEEYTDGYHNSLNRIAVEKNEFTISQYVTGNILEFNSGNSAVITAVAPDGDYLYVDYSFLETAGDEPSGAQGSLLYLYVRDGNTGEALAPGSITYYVSQVGLQGKIFSAFSKYMTIIQGNTVYQWILSIAFATVILLICLGLYRKYNLMFAVVFYLVTLLSPWIIGFSTNLYWMEVTWFLPMLVGIFCSNHVSFRKARIAAYLLTFLTVAFKSACGYEYITVVMLGSIVFLLADFTMALFRKQKEKSRSLFLTIFFMGVAALLGFLVVIIIHARIRGGGDVAVGLQTIYREDLLRRTLGGSADMFQEVYAESLEASIPVVLARYFVFQTPLILGIPGIAFIILTALSFVIAVCGVIRKKTTGEILALYVWLGIMCASWFVLGKAHSYVHTFLNFVMWYMGFVQIIFYIPVQWVVSIVKEKILKKGESIRHERINTGN